MDILRIIAAIVAACGSIFFIGSGLIATGVVTKTFPPSSYRFKNDTGRDWDRYWIDDELYEQTVKVGELTEEIERGSGKLGRSEIKVSFVGDDKKGSARGWRQKVPHKKFVVRVHVGIGPYLLDAEATPVESFELD